MSCLCICSRDGRMGRAKGLQARRSPLPLMEAEGPSYLKKGFFRSRRLLDLEPVWSTWATILMS